MARSHRCQSSSSHLLCFCVLFVGEVFLLHLELQTFLSWATAAERQHTGTPLQRAVVVDSDFFNPCCRSGWKSGLRQIDCSFRLSSPGAVHHTLPLLPPLFSSRIHRKSECSRLSKSVTQWGWKGCSVGCRGWYYPIAITPLLPLATSFRHQDGQSF